MTSRHRSPEPEARILRVAIAATTGILLALACHDGAGPGTNAPNVITFTSSVTDTLRGRVVGFTGTVTSGIDVRWSVGGGVEVGTQLYAPAPGSTNAGFVGEAHSLPDGDSYVRVRAYDGPTMVDADSFLVHVNVPQRHYTATVIEIGGSTDVQPLFLSFDNRIAGHWLAASAVHPFTWKADTLVQLDSLTQVRGLNSSGSVLGVGAGSASMIWKAGAYTTAANFTNAVSINDSGQIVRPLTPGYWMNGTVVNYVAPPSTGPFSIASINNNANITGGRINATKAPTPILWTSPSTWSVPPSPVSTVTPGYNYLTPIRVGDGGHVLMTGVLLVSGGTFGTPRLLVASGNTTTDLSATVGFTIAASSVNILGVVAGTYHMGTAVRAFTWNSGQTTDVVLNTPGWVIDAVYAINNLGRLSAAAHSTADGHHAALILTPVP